MDYFIIIPIILTLILIIIFWYGNRVRGMGSEDKPKFLPNKVSVYLILTIIYISSMFIIDFKGMLAAGTILGYVIPNTQEWMLQGSLFTNLWLCFAFGWGKYFPHGLNKMGENYIYKEKEFWPADQLANFFVGKWDEPKPIDWVKKWQTVGMCGRFGFTFGFLLFPLMAAINESWLTLLGVPGSFLVGYIYRLAFVDHDSKSLVKAEHWTGILLGFLTAMPIWSKYLKNKKHKK